MSPAPGRVSAGPAPAVRLVGWPARAAWLAAGVATAFGAVAALLLPVPGDTPTFLPPLFVAMIACYGGVGALVGTRQPGNPVGWLLLANALILGATLAAQGYAAMSVADYRGQLPGTVILAWLSNWTFLPALGIVLVLVPLLFPTGRLLSARWRWVVLVGVLASVLTLSKDAFTPGNLSGLPGVVNPFGLQPLLAIRPILLLGDPLMVFVGFPLAVLAMVLRFRRGSPTERAQLKWFVSAALFATVFLALSFVAPSPLGDIGWALGILGLGLVPLSIGVALLRYRLYEIDRIISRTIAWTIVSGILVGAFAAAIVALEAALAGFTQGQTLAVAASTLLAFAAFQPLLRRVQSGVDHRFNRARYDAQRTADDFGERLRGEVAMDAVATDLQATIEAAVHPAVQGLWLRGAAP